MKIGIVQLNTIVGDIEENVAKGILAIEANVNSGAEIIVLTELFTIGYPPKDLITRKDQVKLNEYGLGKIIKYSKDIPEKIIIVGYVERNYVVGEKANFNSAVAIKNGAIIASRRKELLPTYDVFAEDRYFQPGTREYNAANSIFEFNGKKIGLIICEEAWNDQEFWKEIIYDHDPVEDSVKNGAEYIISINASPYRMGVVETRHNMVSAHCKKHNIGFCYVNQVGYNDDVGFDGSSFVMNKNGEFVYNSPMWRQDIVVVDTESDPVEYSKPEWQQEVLGALTTGIRDYWQKLGIKGPAIIGLSGGIDSALVAFLATASLGAKNVIGVGMPSEFSSSGSVSDAEKLAQALGIRFAIEPIQSAHTQIRIAVDDVNDQLFTKDDNGMQKTLSMIRGTNTPVVQEIFGKNRIRIEDSGVSDENIQARIRGIYLMTLANFYNGIVLSTGNKSEVAVGYCTIYGDMCGGLSVISDLYKTKVFDLCRWINETTKQEIIPWNTINKPPSAELRKDQKDQDSLPPYDVLDTILEMFVEKAMSPEEICAKYASVDASAKYLVATNRNLVNDIYWVCQMVIRNEFKRKQAATGLKLTSKMFKDGWQYPIVHKMKIGGISKQESGASPAFPKGK